MKLSAYLDDLEECIHSYLAEFTLHLGSNFLDPTINLNVFSKSSNHGLFEASIPLLGSMFVNIVNQGVSFKLRLLHPVVVHVAHK